MKSLTDKLNDVIESEPYTAENWVAEHEYTKLREVLRAVVPLVEACKDINIEWTDCGRCMVIHDKLTALKTKLDEMGKP